MTSSQGEPYSQPGGSVPGGSVPGGSLPGGSVPSALAHHPSAFLLSAQLAVVLLYPGLEGSTAGRATAGVVQMLAVSAAVFAVRRSPELTWVAVLLGLPAMVLAVAEAVDPTSGPIVLVSALFHVPFYCYVSWALVRYLFHDERITRDEIFATGAAFTVVAWAFAYVYAGVQVLWPASFVGSASPEGGEPLTWFELLYLSFSTLTGVGLSDVIPVEGHARSVAILEQVAGVFYLALVVSRIVTLTARRR